MSVEFMKTVYSRLTYDAGSSTNPLRTAVGDRIYAIEAPASAALPLVVYSMDSVDTERYFGGNTMNIGSFTVTVYAAADAGADSILDIEQLVHDILDQQDLVVAGHDRGYVTNISRGVPELNGEVYRSDSSFQMFSHKS